MTDLNRRLSRLEEGIGEALDAAGVPRDPARPPVRIIGDPAEVEAAEREITAAVLKLEALEGPTLIEQPRVDSNLPPLELTVEQVRRLAEAVRHAAEREG